MRLTKLVMKATSMAEGAQTLARRLDNTQDVHAERLDRMDTQVHTQNKRLEMQHTAQVKDVMLVANNLKLQELQ